MEEFAAALTTVAGDCADLCALDEAEGRAADAVHRHLADQESDFLNAVREMDDRYEPYREEFATWIEYASTDDNTNERWPFALAEENDESQNDRGADESS